ncbi:hypothetical protein [Actinoplanes sp. NPDC026619]|uniref:hypothetical protein n=1 Tax=Actinoplanes sp. NPDC026619 TaxID=3155798 RepID=UPI0033C32935
MRDARAEEDEQGLPSYLIMARLLFGWALLALGVLNLAMGLADARYLVFHVVAVIGGGTLLSAGMLRKRPGPAAWLVGGAVAAAGLLISALPRTSAAVCCLSGYDKRHGFPFILLAEKSGHWHLDGLHIVIDLIFWACIGMFALLGFTAAAPERQPAAVPAPQPTTIGRHAEPAATAGHAEPAPAQPPATARHAEPQPGTVDGENVRGLP